MRSRLFLIAEIWMSTPTPAATSSECVILVDNSNIFIEGQKASAMRKGVLPANSGDRQPNDVSWRISFDRLLRQLANGRDIRAAILVGSRPPPNDDVWEMAKQSGFEVITHDRDAANKEKAVDTELVAQGTLLIATTEPAVLVIASGDRDFLPLVNVAHKRKWTVEVAAFAGSIASQLQIAVDHVRPLDGSLDLIGHCEFEWPVR
jgi:uncharacterized LabA/DUF88 family protein